MITKSMHVPILNHKLIGIKNVIDNNTKLNNNSFFILEHIIPNMIYISGNAIYNPFNISLPSLHMYINNNINILGIIIVNYPYSKDNGILAS